MGAATTFPEASGASIACRAPLSSPVTRRKRGIARNSAVPVLTAGRASVSPARGAALVPDLE